jgi:hypothetical protein
MAATNRIEVKKTYKLFINGAFPRSESGRVFEVLSKKGEFVALVLLHVKIYAIALPLHELRNMAGLKLLPITEDRFSIASQRC